MTSGFVRPADSRCYVASDAIIISSFLRLVKQAMSLAWPLLAVIILRLSGACLTQPL